MPNLLSIIFGSVIALGGYKVTKIVWKLYPYMLKPYIGPAKSNHQTVIVCGATDGIGLQYVKWLANQNYKILAIGRNILKLQEVKNISSHVSIYQMDFNTEDFNEQNTVKMIKQIQLKFKNHSDLSHNKVIGIINCVGTAHFSRYVDLKCMQITKIHQTNINSLHFLLKLHQNLKQQNQNNKKPFFINISSAVADNPNKYSSVYSATKAYLSNLIKVVSNEDSNTIYLDVRPWYVNTKMVGYQSTWDSVEPKEIVTGSLSLLGKRKQGCGCWKHQLINQFSWVMKSHISARLDDMMARIDKIKQIRKKR